MNNTQVKDGIFEKNRLIEGRTIYRDGSMYIGQYHNGSHHGHGRFILPSGVWIEGKWMVVNPKESSRSMLLMERRWKQSMILSC